MIPSLSVFWQENDMNKTKAFLAVMLVFIFGFAGGALVTHMVDQSRHETFARGGHQPREDMLLKRLTSKLDLDSRQQEKVRTIIHDTQLAMQQIRRQSRPHIEGVLTEGQQRISALLTPEQNDKFEKILAERKLRRHADEH
jgi:Spy/CpxP family protein refolding chaperone